ncbi:hypothetical protein [uncultured Acetatifactor sp.]|jgi:hypothetical protein|uniref:hypothetical protein n=1 Tax=uncultured Acetatifactor sp. TaxID=1671927 RepID=UPI00263483CD|nr:hypothetical protein [uncultured Acetatifactor sp.]
MVLLDALYIGVQSKMRMARDKAREFFASQQGVANVVATIIVLLIVVLLIGVFWDRLKEWVSNLMDTIFGTKFDDSGLGG